MSDLVWQEPPTSRGQGAHDWSSIAADLQSCPNQWARIKNGLDPRNAGSIAYRIRHGDYNAFQPAGAYEAVSRAEDDGGAVYARYVGEGGAR